MLDPPTKADGWVVLCRAICGDTAEFLRMRTTAYAEYILKVEVTRFPRRSRRLFPRRNRKAAMSYNSVMGKVPPQPEMAAAFL